MDVEGGGADADCAQVDRFFSVLPSESSFCEKRFCGIEIFTLSVQEEKRMTVGKNNL